MKRLMDFASSVPDFRRSDKGNIHHRLKDIVILMIQGRALGYAGRADIIEFGKHNINKYSKMGMFRNGMPSEAILCRVENGIFVQYQHHAGNRGLSGKKQRDKGRAVAS